MIESDLKGVLVKQLRAKHPNWVVFRIEDGTTSGIADIPIVGNKIGSWWEVKHATPGFYVKGVQERTMIRLARAGFAGFIVYWQKAELKRTYIVDPKEIKQPTPTWKKCTEGFDHSWVIAQIEEIHRGNHTVG